MTHEIPINKQAAIFLSRKNRVETIREALEILASRILQPEVRDNIVEMLSKANSKESPCLQMSINIYRDPKTQDQFVVKLKTGIQTFLGEEYYHGLS